MQSSRRNWLKNIGFGMAGIGLSSVQAVASTGPSFINNRLNTSNLSINLNSNENPYGSSSLAKAAMLEYILVSNRYNWELTLELMEALAQKNQVTADNILMGAGSTEILDLVAKFIAAKKGSFIIPNPSYHIWAETARKLGMQKIMVPLTVDKQIDLPAMLSAMKPDTQLVYICNPNNPSGTICERKALVDFISEASKKAIVLVDEAYLDFTRQVSVSNLVIDHPNVIVTKTFSKMYGLAGARIGYAIAHASLVNKISVLRSWSNSTVSVASTAAALASVKDSAFVAETYALNEKAKHYTIAQLEQLKLNCITSHANFIYFSLKNYKDNYFQRLMDHNIVGTYVFEEQDIWTRISIGTMQEMQHFISALQ
ncbi:MAG: pyridoxal phosphate-dependent aminotransferase [Saprospiraceae bacterium]